MTEQRGACMDRLYPDSFGQCAEWVRGQGEIGLESWSLGALLLPLNSLTNPFWRCGG